MKKKTKILNGEMSSPLSSSSSEGEQVENFKEEPSLNLSNLAAEIEDDSRQRKTPQPVEESKQNYYGRNVIY
jgi:hypothetical protein